jgi:hypothetical protein
VNSIRADSNSYTLPSDFNEEEFLSILSDKDEGWLELAATLIDSANYNERTEDMVSTVSRIKVSYPRSEVQEVYNDLVHNGLMANQ